MPLGHTHPQVVLSWSFQSQTPAPGRTECIVAAAGVRALVEVAVHCRRQRVLRLQPGYLSPYPGIGLRSATGGALERPERLRPCCEVIWPHRAHNGLLIPDCYELVTPMDGKPTHVSFWLDLQGPPVVDTMRDRRFFLDVSSTNAVDRLRDLPWEQGDALLVLVSQLQPIGG